MTCPRCGREQSPDQPYGSFCAYCGGMLPEQAIGGPRGVQAGGPDVAGLRMGSIGDLFHRTFKLYISHFRLIVGTYMVWGSLAIVLGAVGVLVSAHSSFGAMMSPAHVAELRQRMPHGLMWYPWFLWTFMRQFLPPFFPGILWGLLGGWAIGATLWAAGAAYLGFQSTPADAVEAAVGRFWPLVGAEILIRLASFVAGVLGLCLFFFTDLLVRTALCLTLPAIMFEGRRCMPALSRSYALVKPDFWRVFGRVFLLLFVVFVAPILIARVLLAPFTGGFAHAGTSEAGTIIMRSVLSSVFGTIIAPAYYIGITLIYFDQRARSEHVQRRAVAQAMGLPPPAAA